MTVLFLRKMFISPSSCAHNRDSGFSTRVSFVEEFELKNEALHDFFITSLILTYGSRMCQIKIKNFVIFSMNNKFILSISSQCSSSLRFIRNCMAACTFYRAYTKGTAHEMGVVTGRLRNKRERVTCSSV